MGDRMNKAVKVLVLAGMMAGALAPLSASAHFQEILPTLPLLSERSGLAERLSMVFTHPMEGGPVMEMGPPQRAGVFAGGKITDLTAALVRQPQDGKTAYQLDYTVPGPGDYQFFLSPAPYWEPAEGKMIVHHSKVVVNALGEEQGWDDLIGLPVEIQPLTRPYGLWTGMVFQGRVLSQGKPVPHAEIEIEYRGQGRITIPDDPFVTQVVKADERGVFTIALPRAGWWGMAALVEGDTPMKAPTGAMVPVEVGGLLWVNVQDMTPAP